MGKIVYNSPFNTLKVEEDYQIVRGKKLRDFRILKNDAVVILPFLDNDTIIIEKQFRFPVNRKLLELPAGSIEKGEKREVAVKRELAEETGYSPKKVKFMFKAWNNPALMNYFEYYYLVWDLYKTKKNLDENEVITPIKMKFNDAIEMVYNGKIKDTKTMLALMFYKNMNKINKLRI